MIQVKLSHLSQLHLLTKPYASFAIATQKPKTQKTLYQVL